MSVKVAILGGGIAGMTAAHELAERGFNVVVYERHPVAGGKARSVGVPETGSEVRRDLPGEHGFRFFPGFYRHVIDTMKRIPHNGKTVFDNLVDTTESQIARVKRTELFIPAHFPAKPWDLYRFFKFFFTPDLGLTPEDLRHYTERLLVLLTSCTGRRFAEYERTDWWTFVGAEERSEAFQKYCADGLTRTCVACRARAMSARTGGYILLQLLFPLARPGAQVDRVLNGPTNDVWIDPWLKLLRERGVDYHLGALVEEIHCDRGRVTGVTIQEGGQRRRVEADYYLAALPVEVMCKLAKGGLEKADPKLGLLGKLRTAWMCGIQFYLARDVSLVHGHTLYIDSPWALTSISQHQFWPDFPLDWFGDGRVKGILSVDISDWETPGLNGKRAEQCGSAEEIANEVWDQLKAHLNDQGKEILRDEDRVCWFLDPNISFPNPKEVPVNLEPLLLNTRGSWQYRPESETSLPNLFLASDYVRTHTDLATMEGANESARRAVNALLGAAGSRGRRCKVWPLREPRVFAPLRWLDRRRFRKGLPHNPLLIHVALWFFVPTWQMLHLCYVMLAAILSPFWRRARRPAAARSVAKARRVQAGHPRGVTDALAGHPVNGVSDAPLPGVSVEKLAQAIPNGGGEKPHASGSATYLGSPEEVAGARPVASAGGDPSAEEFGQGTCPGHPLPLDAAGVAPGSPPEGAGARGVDGCR
jgi:uncharacterized protein with NAD-binding domain and iron-sulfur cluster